MNKYHYTIISITFAIYGFIFYQKYYAGPDVVDYFRNLFTHSTSQLIGSSFVKNKEFQIYSHFNSTFVGTKEYQSNESDYKFKDYIVYFNKDKSSIELYCSAVTDYGEVIGTISINNNEDEEYFYYSNLKSIYAYNTTTSTQKGMKVKCFPN